MSQVLRGRLHHTASRSRCAIEVIRTDTEAVLAMLDDDCAVTLISHPLSWAEVGPQYPDGKAFFQFDQVWQPLQRLGPSGIEPYPPQEAIRKIIRGCYSEPAGFKGGSLEALMDALPHGDIHLFTREWGFIGRFVSLEDAQMIAGALKAVKPIVFSTAEEFMALGTIDQGAVLCDLDPVREWPAILQLKDAMGVLEMAKAKKANKSKKVEKAEGKQRRADGPVSKARAIFESMKSETDSSKIIAACEAQGVNRGTATTQLGRWRKENGIVVKRGGARKKAGTEKGGESANAKAEPSKKADKKKAKDKTKAIPASNTKGEKRHKPPQQSSATSSAIQSSSSADQSKPTSPAAASDPATSPATASTPSTSGTTASGAPAASTPTGAQSSAPVSAGSK